MFSKKKLRNFFFYQYKLSRFFNWEDFFADVEKEGT